MRGLMGDTQLRVTKLDKMLQLELITIKEEDHFNWDPGKGA